MMTRIICLVLIAGFGVTASRSIAGVENQRREGFTEAQIAEISAQFPGCLENTTSSNAVSEDQLARFGGLLPPRADGPADTARPANSRDSAQ